MLAFNKLKRSNKKMKKLKDEFLKKHNLTEADYRNLQRRHYYISL
jgi:hypothetical protein